MHVKTVSFHDFQFSQDKNPDCIQYWLPELREVVNMYWYSFFIIRRGAWPIAAVLTLTFSLEKLFFAIRGWVRTLIAVMFIIMKNQKQSKYQLWRNGLFYGKEWIIAIIVNIDEFLDHNIEVIIRQVAEDSIRYAPIYIKLRIVQN